MASHGEPGAVELRVLLLPPPNTSITFLYPLQAWGSPELSEAGVRDTDSVVPSVCRGSRFGQTAARS
ncbi:hypothetical protein DPEC_G00124770 [Dallia pectoralis]|uniref:Uncharacterized protein n=1 Tax=Dallia pectoralis TaxID=75939 RepID=A0ACC2GRB2_DALPE|nr:hypothetical protein DPEC_G00124770 [Dallia pectoralis]